MRLFLLFFTVAMTFACGGPANTITPNINSAKSNVSNATSKQSGVPVYTYEVVKTYPHDPNAFTEGLFYHDGFLYESTGQEGHSSLRKVDLETGKVLQKFDLPRDSFGEGISLYNGLIYQLTWRENLCRVFDINTF